MNKPKFLIRIKGKESACLSEQLLLILKIINNASKDYIWYACDVEISGEIPFKLGLEGWIPKRIGHTTDLVKIVQNVEQFLSGVFFALPLDFGEFWDHEFSTEDKPFRDMEEAFLEIRAFDTSYFEVYANDSMIIKELAKYFSVEIENNKGRSAKNSSKSI